MMHAYNTAIALKLDCTREIWFDGDRHSEMYECDGKLYILESGVLIIEYNDPVLGRLVTLSTDGKQLELVAIGGDTLTSQSIKLSQSHKLDEWFSVKYYAPNKSMVMRSLTKQLEIEIDDYGGSIELAYELYSGDSCLGLYAMDLFFDCV